MTVCWEEQTATNTPKYPENPSVTQHSWTLKVQKALKMKTKKPLLPIVITLNPMDLSLWTCTGAAMTLKKQ